MGESSFNFGLIIAFVRKRKLQWPADAGGTIRCVTPLGLRCRQPVAIKRHFTHLDIFGYFRWRRHLDRAPVSGQEFFAAFLREPRAAVT
jgi:hypothetical protein